MGRCPRPGAGRELERLLAHQLESETDLAGAPDTVAYGVGTFLAPARTGSTNTYTITVTENVGTGFLTAPAVHGGANPIRIHFR